MAMRRPSVVDFDSLDAFLRAWLKFAKSQRSAVSYRFLARRTGLSHGYLANVVKGARKVSRANAPTIARMAAVSADEDEAFQALLDLQHARSTDEAEEARKRIRRIRHTRDAIQQGAEVPMEQVIADWLTLTLYEMVALPDFRAEVPWIQERLAAEATVEQIEAALEQLEPVLRQRGHHKVLHSGHEVAVRTSTVVHEQMMDRAVEALTQHERADRHFTGFTVACTREQFEELKRSMAELVDKWAADLDETDPAADRVVQAQAQLFHLTDPSR